MLGITDYLWRLVPGNPILLRVVQTAGKRRRDLIIRSAYLGLLIVAVTVSLLGGGVLGEADLSRLAKRSAALFQTMSYLQLALVALLAPVFTAGAIAAQKESQTYDILLSTPLTNGQIVLGSLLSRLFFVIALLISGIPVFAITQIFGGVAIGSIAMSFAIAAATAFVTGALALAIATVRLGSGRTIFGFYLFLIVYLAALWMGDALPWFRIAGAGTSWLTGLHPFLALRVIFRGPDYLPPDLGALPAEWQRWPIGWYLSNPAAFYVWFMSLAGLLLVLPSIALLRRVAQSADGWRARLLGKLRFWRLARTRRPRGVWNNPIAWREARTKASTARATLLRYGFILVGLFAAVVLAAMYHTDLPAAARISASAYDPVNRELTVIERDTPTTYRLANNTVIRYAGDPVDDEIFGRELAVTEHTLAAPGSRVLATIDLAPLARRLSIADTRGFLLGLVLVEFTVILLIVTNAAASTVTREKEDGTLDLLLSTPITSRYYIWGKLSGLVGFAVPLLAVPLISVLLLILTDFALSGAGDPWLVHPEALLVLPGTLLIVAAFAAMVGMHMSLRLRRTVVAVMSAVGVVAGLCFLLGYCGLMALDNMRGASELAMALAGFSPFTILTVLIDPTRFGGRVFAAGTPGQIVQARLLLGLFSWIATGLYALVVWSMYKSMVKNFDVVIRRQSR